MTILVRKIAENKWPKQQCAMQNICGDAVTDLKTSNNTLSLWAIKSIDDLDSAILALAASSKTSHLEKIFIVWFSDEDLQGNVNNIVFDRDVLGDTIVQDLANTHVNLSVITYKTLGELSAFIIDKISSSEQYTIATRNKVKSLIRDAYYSNRICESKCSDKLLLEIKKIA